MTAPMTESWIRIEAWLAAHAPVTYAALAPPAEPAQISAAEEAAGLAFPDELKESLLRHDGMDHGLGLLPSLWRLLSTEEIVRQRALRITIYERDPYADFEEDEDPEAEAGPWWHRQWLPFASSGGGDHLVVDLRPTRLRGRIGDACHEDLCTFRKHPMWSSLPALFEMTATALETGELLDECEPFVTAEGELDWEP